MNPKYPVFIVSKGRAESRLTSKALEEMKVPYYIIVEPQERDQYVAVINPEKILVTPFSNLGKGSIPARNYAWELAIGMGVNRFWLMDDNVRGFSRLNHNEKHNVTTGTMLKAAEDFVDRYTNIAIAGLGYHFMGGGERRKKPPFKLNVAVYSCMLIRTDIMYAFRGIYNEDTDLSLRVLKDGWCTLVFNTFLQNKVATMTLKGGNTDELYAGDGRRKMAEYLRDEYPDIVKIKWKFNRWQHEVDYRPFKNNKLERIDGLRVPEGINNYGMVLVEKS